LGGLVVNLGNDGSSGLSGDRVFGDLLVAAERALQLLDHLVLGDGDDRRRAGRHAVADLLQIFILETLVADLSPQPAGTAANGGGDDDAGREDQADNATRDRP